MPKAIRNPRNAILQALLKTNATWTELLNETGLSKGALSKYLEPLTKEGLVKRDVDASERPPRVRYSIVSLPKETIETAVEKIDLEEYYGKLVQFASQSGAQISQLKVREQAKGLLKDYLTFNLEVISSLIPLFIDYSYAYLRGFKKGRAERGKELDPKKQYEVYLRELKEQYMNKFLEPWIESLAYTAFQNQDIAFDVAVSGVYPVFGMEKGKKIDTSFFDKIQMPKEKKL